ncbi:GPP34 family phosphoprotein [Georgenia sp. TF02-10]|uniref:GOLPH3/VPS74 family protein n=1 Tax=Georgenia sp. TF02-10 TaxID=2917725 RepID=UPI001FA77C36|nr:GPP34 family phosphoprotein [Georgenia sp. TF02-10]UNX53992.1 GPP34 family phosphoprotein [Georgenia sp. TF02-10]
MGLLLAEQTLLIALDDEKGRSTALWAGEAGLAAALLLDLGRSGHLTVGPDKKLVAAGGEPPAHDVLGAAYRAIRDSAKPRDAKGWVDRLQRELRPLGERLARGLVARGVLSEERSRVLGLFPTTRFPAADPVPEMELRRGLGEVLVIGRTPTEEEALLVGLLEPLELVDRVVAKEDRRAARRRAKEIGESGVVGDAVGEAVRDLQAAVMIGTIAASVGGTAAASS